VSFVADILEIHDDGKELQGSRNVSEHVEGEEVDMSAMKTTSEVDQTKNSKELGGTGIWSPFPMHATS